MTHIRQQVAGLVVLTTVSAVSLMAGGLILGAASADDGGDDSAPTAAGASVRPMDDASGKPTLTAIAGDEKACFIAYGVEPPEGVIEHVFSAKPVQGMAGSNVERGKFIEANGEVKTFTLVDGELVEGELPEGGLPKDGPIFTKAIEAKPLSPEEIERLKASGELQVFTPEDCTVVNPEDLPVPAVKKAP